jgi:hypothetical protein
VSSTNKIVIGVVGAGISASSFEFSCSRSTSVCFESGSSEWLF